MIRQSDEQMPTMLDILDQLPHRLSEYMIVSSTRCLQFDISLELYGQHKRLMDGTPYELRSQMVPTLPTIFNSLLEILDSE